MKLAGINSLTEGAFFLLLIVAIYIFEITACFLHWCHMLIRNFKRRK